jgi:hypothetical protein
MATVADVAPAWLVELVARLGDPVIDVPIRSGRVTTRRWLFPRDCRVELRTFAVDALHRASFEIRVRNRYRELDLRDVGEPAEADWRGALLRAGLLGDPQEVTG